MEKIDVFAEEMNNLISELCSLRHTSNDLSLSQLLWRTRSWNLHEKWLSICVRDPLQKEYTIISCVLASSIKMHVLACLRRNISKTNMLTLCFLYLDECFVEQATSCINFVIARWIFPLKNSHWKWKILNSSYFYWRLHRVRPSIFQKVACWPQLSFVTLYSSHCDLCAGGISVPLDGF